MCYTGEIRCKWNRGVEMMLVNYCNCLKIRYPERHDKNKYFCIKEYFEEEWEAAWLFQFIPDYFSCLPLTTSLSVISLLSAAARPSFLSLFYAACKRTSIFVLLPVPSSCSSPSPLLFLHLINLLPGDVWVQRFYLSCNQSGTGALIEVRDIPWICRIQRSISFPPIATIRDPEVS